MFKKHMCEIMCVVHMFCRVTFIQDINILAL